MSTIKNGWNFHPFHVKKRLSKISENDKTLRLKLNILPLRYFCCKFGNFPSDILPK